MLRQSLCAIGLLATVFAGLSCGRSAQPGESTVGGFPLAAELAELEALNAPEGVDPALFAELKQSLASLLTARAGADGRIVSAVPSGPAGEVTDLHFDAAGTLHWSYVNRGDYDQNSEVNAADIVPIAAHFRKNSTSPDWAAAQVADGDGNGEINAADIVPLAGNFRGTVSGYRIQTSADGASGWSDVNDVPFSAATAPGAFLTFEATPDALVPDNWYRVTPFSGSETGAPSNAVQYAAPIPQVVSVSPLSGREGANVQFAAVVSGPAPDTYSWDFGGGAVPNTSSEQSPSVTLGAPGSYSAGVLVSNTEGEDSFTFTLTVNPNQSPQASFTATPQSGSPGQVVQLDASASFDPDGAVVHYEWDLDGDQNFETDGGANPTQATTLPDPIGTVEIALRVTDDSAATDIATLELSSANQPPVASFTATPQFGSPGTQVQLDASASSDPDGVIVQYEWDLDGDGSYETDGGASATQATALPDPEGTVTVSLRVTDDSSAESSTTVTLSSIPLTWTIAVVDANAGGSGDFTSLAVINGKPAISYFDYISDRLMYAHSNTVDGASGWSSVNVDNVGTDFGYVYSSLALINDKPAISYYDGPNHNLKYAYSSSDDGSSGWNSLTVDNSDFVGTYTSLALINDKPAISYSDGNEFNLKFAYSSMADGSSGWSVVTVDDVGQVGGYSSLTVLASGRPAISYAGVNSRLGYAYSSTVDGSSGWSTLTIETSSTLGVYTSLAAIGGAPGISSWNFDTHELMFSSSTLPDGSGSWSTQVIDGGGTGVGEYTSLALINGRPGISYYDATNQDLKYAFSSSPDGSSGWTTVTVDSFGSVGAFTSLAQVDGRPAISYYDWAAGVLKYAILDL